MNVENCKGLFETLCIYVATNESGGPALPQNVYSAAVAVCTCDKYFPEERCLELDVISIGSWFGEGVWSSRFHEKLLARNCGYVRDINRCAASNRYTPVVLCPLSQLDARWITRIGLVFIVHWLTVMRCLQMSKGKTEYKLLGLSSRATTICR
jgi:hypothetical protein